MKYMEFSSKMMRFMTEFIPIAAHGMRGLSKMSRKKAWVLGIMKPTWRIIPVSKWMITIVGKSPK